MNGIIFVKLFKSIELILAINIAHHIRRGVLFPVSLLFYLYKIIQSTEDLN